MIRDNFYSILGLESTADQKQISKRAKDISKYLEIGEIPEFKNDLFFIKKYRSSAYIKNAIDGLSVPKKKIIHYFFWFDIESEDDKKLFGLVNNGEYENVINLVKKSGNKRNLAILYSLFLGESEISKDISNIIANILVEIVPLFKGISEDDKFWELFEKKYLLYDDLGTNSEIIVDFRDNLPKYLSDIFYNISNILGNKQIIKEFHSSFKNIKGEKTIEQTEKIYFELEKLSEELKNMNISADGVFDDEERKTVKNIHTKVLKLLEELKELGLYEDSKTLIVRDEIAKSFRTIALDLNNNLDEEKEALKIFKDAFLLVGTEGLEQKLREDIDILNTNSELRPVIELLEEEKYIEAYEELDNYDDTKMSPREEEDIKVLKARAILGRLLKGFLKGKELFEKENYVEAKGYFTKTEELASNHVKLFDGLSSTGLNNLLDRVRGLLNQIKGQSKENINQIFEQIDDFKTKILEKLYERDKLFFVCYIDSITYGFLSELAINKKSGWKGILGIIFIIVIFSGIKGCWDDYYDSSSNSYYNSNYNNFSFGSITCGLNSYSLGDTCYCKGGYTRADKNDDNNMNCISYTQDCQKTYGVNSERSGTEDSDGYYCDCKSGYKWSIDGSSCVREGTPLNSNDFIANNITSFNTSQFAFMLPTIDGSYITDEDLVTIKGKILTEGIDSIIVDYYFGGKLEDSYQLQQYNASDLTWSYNAGIKYGNLKEGLNSYHIKFYSGEDLGFTDYFYITKNKVDKGANCNTKYAGTIYRSSDDKCVCANGVEWSNTNYCEKNNYNLNYQTTIFGIYYDNKYWEQLDGNYTWEEAKKSCEDLGNGRRLPTMYELCPGWEWDDQNRFNINGKGCPNYENIKNKLNFINDYYWSSTQNSSSYLIETTGHTVLATYWHINFYSGYTNVNEDYYNIKHHAICIHN